MPKSKKPEYETVVILDSSGTAIGVIKLYGKGENIEKTELLDNRGKFICYLDKGDTVMKARETLLKTKMVGIA